MSEFELIDKYCRGIGPKHDSTIIDLGDDAAVIRPDGDADLAISTDTMVESVHFLAGTQAGHLAHKILNVNCSDMAAMGAQPKYATLSMSLPSKNESWLAQFSSSLKQQADHHNVQLIGGDTTKGKLSLTCTIIGLLNKSKAISRSGVELGDDIYVSNVVGDAALGLASLKGELSLPTHHRLAAEVAHYRPQARVELGRGLLNIANAGMDVSDGLIADLRHLCDQSEVAMEIELDRVPLSDLYQYYLQNGGDHDFALYGGDDYELIFSCHPDKRAQVQSLSESLGLSLTRIGKAVEATNSKKISFQVNGKSISASDSLGYNHFA